jgi:hypothetical protein
VVLRADIAKFCGAYSKVRSTYCSGHSDDIVMEKARKWYKGKNQNKSFTLEYLCRDLKDLPKWRILPEEDESKNRETKISEPEANQHRSGQERVMGNNNAQFLVLHNFSIGGFRGFGTNDGESDAEQERNWRSRGKEEDGG